MCCRKGVVLPNLKLYRRTWLAAILLALFALVALRPTDAPTLSATTPVFDGKRAMADLQTIAEDFPKRTVGSDASNRAAIWISDTVTDMGLEPVVEPFPTTIDGNETSLQNVWAISGKRSARTIVLVANRDTSSLTREGANDNASGVATVLELARVFSVQRHARSIVFLWTDGDSYGAVGTKAFLDAHPELDVVAAVAVREMATPNPTRVELNGWSASENVAPAWLWAAGESAGRAETRLPTPLPNIFSQTLHLAVPVGGGSQGPFVEKGIPAITVSVAGRDVQPADDTTDNVSRSTLTRAGRAVERLVTTIDEQPGQLRGADAGLFFSRYRRMSGAALNFALVVLLIPLAAVTVDLVATRRRRQASLGPAWLLYIIRVAPWLVMLIILYLTNAVGLLPGSPGPAIPPDSLVADNPRYLRVLLLAALLIAVVFYAHAVERRFLRRVPVAVENTVTVVHVVLLVASLLVLFVNPFSVLLLLPAAILWPLARRGPWPVSRAPAWMGLIGIVVALFFFGLQLDLGADVWWYFFLLVEDRTVPAPAALLGAAVIAGALHLGHHLHEGGTGRSVLAGPPGHGRPATERAAGGDAEIPGGTPSERSRAPEPGGESQTVGNGRAAMRRMAGGVAPRARLSSRPGRATGR